MNLVLCNMSNTLDWEQGIVNRNFFVANELARSGEFEHVLMVDFLAINPVGFVFGSKRTAQYVWKSLVSPQKMVRRYGARHALHTWNPEGQTGMHVFVLSGFGLPGWRDRDVALVGKAMRDLGFTSENTVLWSYQAFVPEFLDLPARVRVFDAVDDWSQHASYNVFQEVLKANYKAIGAKADLIFTVSEGLREIFPTHKSQWVPNGVDVDAFVNKMSPPQDIADIRKPLVGYVGTVQERIDFSLMRHVCSSVPDARFLLVGPVWAGVQKDVDALTSACPNVTFLGRRPYAQVPAYLQAMDVCIIPHRIDDFIRSTNPMKLYDYLAAGKPVVTTPGAGTEVFANVIRIAHTPQDFVDGIRNALLETGPQLEAARRKAVETHTWRARVSTMRELLQRAIVDKTL